MKPIVMSLLFALAAVVAAHNVSAEPRGETGPIIEGFRCHHDDGRILQIIDDPQTVECRMDGLQSK